MCAKQVKKKYRNKNRQRNRQNIISKAQDLAGLSVSTKDAPQTLPSEKSKIDAMQESSEVAFDEEIQTDRLENDQRSEKLNKKIENIGATDNNNNDQYNDQRSVSVERDDEISLPTEKQDQGESKNNDRANLISTHEAALSQIDIEIDRPKNPVPSSKRRNSRKLFWWIIGIVLTLVIIGGTTLAYCLGQPQDSHQNQEQDQVQDRETNDSDNENSDKNEGESNAEPEPPAEETPADKKTPQPQPETPIVDRPGQNTGVPAVEPGSKVIALTFDDGPSAATTPRLLDILQGRNVKATFFVLGNLALRSPDLVRREETEGHEVASHTPYHNQLTRLSFSQVRAEAVEMDRIFNEILGHVPPFTRPPYGSYNAAVGEALAQPMILWSIDPRDWADRNASIVCSRVTSAAFDGAIILVHDIHSTTVDAVPCIIDNLRAQGYKFLTVSELAAYRGVSMVNGATYGSF